MSDLKRYCMHYTAFDASGDHTFGRADFSNTKLNQKVARDIELEVEKRFGLKNVIAISFTRYDDD